MERKKLASLAEVKKDNTIKTVSIQSYRPASLAGLTPCAKRITPPSNSFSSYIEWNFIFPVQKHKFSVQIHIFPVQKHKFSVQKHKK